MPEVITEGIVEVPERKKQFRHILVFVAFARSLKSSKDAMPVRRQIEHDVPATAGKVVLLVRLKSPIDRGVIGAQHNGQVGVEEQRIGFPARLTGRVGRQECGTAFPLGVEVILTQTS
jgi:hypothetical protein